MRRPLASARISLARSGERERKRRGDWADDNDEIAAGRCEPVYTRGCCTAVCAFARATVCDVLLLHGRIERARASKYRGDAMVMCVRSMYVWICVWMEGRRCFIGLGIDTNFFRCRDRFVILGG